MLTFSEPSFNHLDEEIELDEMALTPRTDKRPKNINTSANRNFSGEFVLLLILIGKRDLGSEKRIRILSI